MGDLFWSGRSIDSIFGHDMTALLGAMSPFSALADFRTIFRLLVVIFICPKMLWSVIGKPSYRMEVEKADFVPTFEIFMGKD